MGPQFAIMLVVVIGITVLGGSAIQVLGRYLERRSRGLNQGEVGALREELERLQQVVGGLQGLQDRVGELEERLDFAERVLVRHERPGLPPQLG